jgi:hypothetical protein
VISWLLILSILPLLDIPFSSPTAWLDAPVGAVIGAAAWALFGKGILRHPDDNPPARVRR